MSDIEWMIGKKVTNVELHDDGVNIQFDNDVLLVLRASAFVQQPRPYLALHQYKNKQDWQPTESTK